MRLWRQLAMLLLTGIVIELALMPIGLFHFHRAGIFGAFANVIAIPLTTFVSMPAIAVALLLDGVGMGAPAWWLAGASIDLMLAMARFVAARPGAVSLVPAMAGGSIALLVVGGLWLALWQGRVRLLGLIPAAAGAIWLAQAKPPDVLISGDGRQVAITGALENRLLVLRVPRGDYAREKLNEAAGMAGEGLPVAQWPQARCSRDFCVVPLERGERTWHLLLSVGQDRVEERSLAAACAHVDIVVSDRWLPRSCRPAWIKADRAMLRRTGGLALDLGEGSFTSVAMGQGQHGWWNPERSRPPDRDCAQPPCASRTTGKPIPARTDPAPPRTAPAMPDQ